MKKTILSFVPLIGRSHCKVVVKPTQYLLSIKRGLVIYRTKIPIFVKCVDLRIVAFASVIIVANGVIGSDCGDWRR